MFWTSSHGLGNEKNEGNWQQGPRVPHCILHFLCLDAQPSVQEEKREHNHGHADLCLLVKIRNVPERNVPDGQPKPWKNSRDGIGADQEPDEVMMKKWERLFSIEILLLHESPVILLRGGSPGLGQPRMTAAAWLIRLSCPAFWLCRRTIR
jgi:hypothetical protein